MDHDQQNASKESQEKVLYWINKSTIENDRYVSDILRILALLTSRLEGKFARPRKPRNTKVWSMSCFGNMENRNISETKYQSSKINIVRFSLPHRFPAALAGSQTTNAAFADTAEKKTFCNHDNVLICKPHKLHGGRKMLSCVFYLESDNALV